MKTLIYSIFLFLFLLIQKADGQIVFNYNYDIDSVLNGLITVTQTLDGGYITGGTNADINTGASKAFVIKTNSEGDSLWTRVWDFSLIGGDQVRSILQLNDSSYIIQGNTVDTVAMNWDVYLLKLNTSGDMLWMKTYAMGTGIDLGYMVKKATDGGFVIAGRTTSNTNGYEDAYLIKTDSEGILQWQYQYGGTGGELIYSLDLAADGGYILGGSTTSYGLGDFDLYLIKVNGSGIFQWQKTFGTMGYDQGETIIRTLDGGYAFVGAIEDAGGETDAYIVKTNSSGNIQWSKTHGDSGISEGFKVIKQLPDSTYIVTGWINTVANDLQGWLVKLSQTGDSLWSKDYGSPGALPDYFWGLNLTSDGGFIICGEYNRIGPPYQNAWLVKTDCMGNDTAWDTVNCSLVSGISDDASTLFNSMFDIKVYPNPNNGNMQFAYALTKGETGELSLYEITGRKITDYKLATGNKVIPVSETSLNSGIYFYIYKVNGSVVKSDKILIIK